jgi:hypothetical protein
MVPGCLVAATVTFAVVCPGTFGDMRMTILIAVVDVGSAMVVVILPRAFDAVVVSLPLDIAKLLRGRIPVTVAIAVTITILVRGCRSWGGKRFGRSEAGCRESKYKCWDC